MMPLERSKYHAEPIYCVSALLRYVLPTLHSAVDVDALLQGVVSRVERLAHVLAVMTHANLGVVL